MKSFAASTFVFFGLSAALPYPYYNTSTSASSTSSLPPFPSRVGNPIVNGKSFPKIIIGAHSFAPFGNSSVHSDYNAVSRGSAITLNLPEGSSEDGYWGHSHSERSSTICAGFQTPKGPVFCPAEHGSFPSFGSFFSKHKRDFSHSYRVDLPDNLPLGRCYAVLTSCESTEINEDTILAGPAPIDVWEHGNGWGWSSRTGMATGAVGSIRPPPLTTALARTISSLSTNTITRSVVVHTPLSTITITGPTPTPTAT